MIAVILAGKVLVAAGAFIVLGVLALGSQFSR